MDIIYTHQKTSGKDYMQQSADFSEKFFEKELSKEPRQRNWSFKFSLKMNTEEHYSCGNPTIVKILLFRLL